MNAYNNGFRSNAPQPPSYVSAVAKKLPPEYVDLAEKVMMGLIRQDNKGNAMFDITLSKIRKILSLITDILNDENLRQEDTLTDESYQKLQMARVRIAYDAGREQKVKDFVVKSELLSYIKGVGRSRVEFIKFARYVESLVAWHRYMGGSN
ncbi:MAG: type III-A CRISPR-associated protein Csm2 [Synergistaceae bacterium]|nr:type III-A CRISPR-associated protein Csm2 [Synergistaceae bacterium]